MNPTRELGDVPIELDGEQRVLRYTWRALAAWGDAFADRSPDLNDPRELAQVVAIGLQHHHEGATADDVMRASPPMAPTVDAVSAAYTYAMHGTIPEPNEKKKRRSPTRTRTGWLGRLLTQFSTG